MPEVTASTIPAVADLNELVTRLERLSDAEDEAVEQARKILAAIDGGVDTGRWEVAIYSECTFMLSLLTTNDSTYEGAADLLERARELRELVAAA